MSEIWDNYNEKQDEFWSNQILVRLEEHGPIPFEQFKAEGISDYLGLLEAEGFVYEKDGLYYYGRA